MKSLTIHFGKNGLTLVELMLTIAILSVGIFPLITGLGNITDMALKQKDYLTAMSIGTWRMDAWLDQFQAIDAVLGEGSTAYTEKSIIYPGIVPGSASLLTDENKIYRDIFMNDSFFRTESIFTPMDGTKGNPDLSNNSRIIYRIDVNVWKIQNPQLTDTLKEYNEPRPTTGAPGFARGDHLLYQVSTLYSQNNRFNPVFVEQ